jgi:tRNA(Ile)-lysidine synthase
LTSSLLLQVLAFIRSQDLVQPYDRILVGCSGGPDSTALLHLLHRLAHLWPIILGVAHFDHALRGDASRADADWVANLAVSLNLPFYFGTDDVRHHKQKKKISLQTAARQLRLKFFQEIRQKHHYHTLALGHTADDQVELFFLRLLRGAGPEGIKGMWPYNPTGIIRPLLGTSKSQIISWLESEGLPYCLDKSNLSRNYRRNQLRLDLLPRLLAYNPRLGEAITRFQTLLQEQEDYLHQKASQVFSGLEMKSDNGPLRLPVAKLLALHPALQKRVLRLACDRTGVPLERLTFRHMEAALHLCRQPQSVGEISLPGNWRLLREGDQIIWQLAPTPRPPEPEQVMVNLEAGRCTFLDRTFTWTVYPIDGYKKITASPSHIAMMDFQKLQYPLKLRTFRPGDRFQPLGMAGVKKLQDFFVDAKIPRAQRSSIPLLLSRDQIVWVVGHRLSELAKVTPQTQLILRLEASPLLDVPDPGPPR